METYTCRVALDKSWLTEVPRITCIELHETAKLLPQLINTEEKEDDMTEEENRSSSPASSSSITQLNPRPSLVSAFDDQGAEMIAESSARKNLMSTQQPQKPPNVPLVPSVFSSEVIPQYTAKHSQHYGLVPGISIEDSSYYETPSPSEVAHPPSPLVNNRLLVPSTERRSSIPKLPQIPASHRPHTQPIRPRHHSHNPTHHSSRLLSPDSSKKPTVPLQLQYLRQQHQMPIQDTSRAIHPSGMVGGVFTSRRRRLTHPGYIRKEEQPVDFTPPIVSYGAMTKVYPESHFYINPQPQVNHSLKPVSVHFDYLRKTSRKVELAQPVKSSEENESVGELGHSLIEKETTPQEKEERKKKILRKATLLHLNESDEKADYIVDFKNVKVDAKTKQIINKFRGGIIGKLDNLTDEIRDDYDQFLTEVDAVTFYARRQAEELLQDYSPRTLLIISSAVPKAGLLQAATKPEVLTLIYDFESDSYASLLRKIKELLDSYMVGAKSKSLAFVCKGGPGYMYLLQRKPITPAKLLKENDLLKFWKEIGCLMSKISLSDPSVVHLIESNVAGNRQGIELLSNLEAAMFTNRVKVFSPLELEPKGRDMIGTYFFPEKFKMWKSKRYSKVKLF